MIESITTTFNFKKLQKIYKHIFEELISNQTDKEFEMMKRRIKSGISVKGRMKPISNVSKIVRSLNKHSIMNPPLNASGRLLKSITRTKTGIRMNKYGIYHNEGYTTNNTPVIPPTKTAPKGLKKRKFDFKGKTIPKRQFMHTTDTLQLNKEAVSEFFKAIAKNLKDTRVRKAK